MKLAWNWQGCFIAALLSALLAFLALLVDAPPDWIGILAVGAAFNGLAAVGLLMAQEFKQANRS